ncbi:MAG: CDP-alcohol phosphatidyltransferase family protein [Candidatus Zixiibacteriota bacterium]
MIIRKRDFFLIPNLLAILRILLFPFIFYFLAQDTHSSLIVGMVLIALAVGSDVLDGYAARRLNQITDLGRILDPVADKLGLGIFVIFIIIYRGFPIWAAVLLFSKDLLTLTAGLLMVRRKGFVLMSNNWGKLNSWIWVFTLVIYIVRIHQLQQWFLVLVTLSTLNCIVQYVRMFAAQYRVETKDG